MFDQSMNLFSVIKFIHTKRYIYRCYWYLKLEVTSQYIHTYKKIYVQKLLILETGSDLSICSYIQKDICTEATDTVHRKWPCNKFIHTKRYMYRSLGYLKLEVTYQYVHTYKKIYVQKLLILETGSDLSICSYIQKDICTEATDTVHWKRPCNRFIHTKRYMYRRYW